MVLTANGSQTLYRLLTCFYSLVQLSLSLVVNANTVQRGHTIGMFATICRGHVSITISDLDEYFYGFRKSSLFAEIVSQMQFPKKSAYMLSTQITNRELESSANVRFCLKKIALGGRVLFVCGGLGWVNGMLRRV